MTGSYPAFIVHLFSVVSGGVIGKNVAWDTALFFALGLCAFFSFRAAQEKKWGLEVSGNNLAVLLWVVIPVALYVLIDFFFSPILFVRYMGFIHIPLIILFSKGLGRLGKRVGMPLLVLITCSIFFNHLMPYYENNLKLNGENWKKVFEQIRLTKEPGDSIFLDTFGSPLSGIFIRGAQEYSGQKQILAWDDAAIRKVLERKPRSLFVLYRNFKSHIQAPEGYVLKDDFSIKSNDFMESLWVKDFKAFVGFLHFRKKEA